MPIPYTRHDRGIADSVIFNFLAPDPSDDGPDSGKITFQFPPKMVSDNRRGNWKEGELAGTEPVSVFATSSAREMTLTWSYIVEYTRSSGGNQFDIDFVRRNVNRLRGYFANYRANNQDRKGLIVRFKYSAITGTYPWTCRIKSVDVKYSDNLIGPPNRVFPLRTDITVDLRLWTEETVSPGSGADVIDLPLSDHPSFDDYWY